MQHACKSKNAVMQRLGYQRIAKVLNCLTGKRSAVQICVSSQKQKELKINQL